MKNLSHSIFHNTSPPTKLKAIMMVVIFAFFLTMTISANSNGVNNRSQADAVTIVSSLDEAMNSDLVEAEIVKWKGDVPSVTIVFNSTDSQSREIVNIAMQTEAIPEFKRLLTGKDNTVTAEATNKNIDAYVTTGESSMRSNVWKWPNSNSSFVMTKKVDLNAVNSSGTNDLRKLELCC